MNRFELTDSLSLMKELENGSVDLVLTDPPYIISKPSGFKSVVHGEKRFAVSTEHGEWKICEIPLLSITVFSRSMAQ